MDTEITAISAWEVFDSRGMPTVACEVRLSGGARGQATVPSGASRGHYEVHELRDGGNRYGGQGVRSAIRNVRSVVAKLAGHDASDQTHVDRMLRELDGTPELGRLGANAVLAVSVAAALAAAAAQGISLYRQVAGGNEPLVLPLPMVNILSGGAHAGGAVDMQDFLAIPVGASSFTQAIEWVWRVRRGTVEAANERGLPSSTVGDEGGLGLSLPSNRAAVELLARGIDRTGLSLGDEIALGIDVAASQLAVPGGYRLEREDRVIDAGTLLDDLEAWCASHPIVSIEDPLGEDDWEGWLEATRRFGSRVQLVGDDLFATSVERLERGITGGAANALLIKPNQAGTLSDAHAALVRALGADYAPIVSARSGDTEDSWLADLAVGWRAGQIKVGSLTRSERTAKWNRLLQIEAEHRNKASFAGKTVLAQYRTRTAED